MKKLILVLLSATCFKTQAAEYIYTDFWYAIKPPQLKLKVESLQESLAEECDEHFNTVSNFVVLTAEEVDFYNKLPLKKQMGSKFLSVFRLKGLSAADQAALMKLKSPLLNLEVDSYSADFQKAGVKILSYRANSLSVLSVKAGAALLAPEFKINSVMSDEIFLTVERRDIACDLINKRIQLAVTAPVLYSLSPDSQHKISLYMDHLGRSVQSILSKNESEYVKAAKIGLMAAELQTTGMPSTQLVEHIFAKLFVQNSLRLNGRWSYSTDGSTYLAPEYRTSELTENILIEL